MTLVVPARILVLEDEWMIAEQIETTLREAEFDIVGPVGEIEQALELIDGGTIEAAVLDLNIHGDRSFRVADRLVLKSIPFLFLSGYSEAEIPARFRERPLLIKPLDPIKLRGSVDALVASGKRQDKRL